MSAIVEVLGREVLDSRGNPTVEAEVVLESGALAVLLSPAVPLQAAVKLSNSVTETSPVTWAKVFSMP